MAQTFVYNSGTYQETNSETIHLEFGLFFDGNLNNKNNTDLRLKVLNQNDLKILPTDNVKTILWKEKMIEKRRERFEKDSLDKDSDNKDKLDPKDITDYQKADKRSRIDKLGVDNSLMNDYTNVARMWKCCDDNYRIYIEGIGTLDKQKDIDDGFRFGAGETGIRGKVRRGCYELAMKIKSRLPKETNELVEITLDVFGFSRGAAAARNFLYEINVPNKRDKDTALKSEKIEIPINIDEYGFKGVVNIEKNIFYDKDNVLLNSEFLIGNKMPKYGYLGYYLLQKGIDPYMLKLRIRFVGLYDTVSSYEESGNLIKGMCQASHLADYFDDDVEQLQLNNLGKFQQAVHFTAMNEHRENFALTRFSKKMLSQPNCIEMALPGVHCDIGGAYETGTEYVDEIDNSNYNSDLDTFCEDLISQYWYKREQLDLSFFKLSGTRFLRKEYSYIPLHFMEFFFIPNLSDKYESIFRVSTLNEYSIADDYILNKSKEYLEKYTLSERKEWKLISNDEIYKKFEQEKKKLIKEKAFSSSREHRELKEVKIRKEDENRVATQDKLEKSKYSSTEKEKYYEQIEVETWDRDPIFEEQYVLRVLRNKYLHWSANRDWFGMDPTSDRKRKEY